MCPEWLHPGNSAQAEFWNGPVGHGWVDRQEIQDAILGPVDDSLFASASLQPGEAVIDVGCGCGATTIEFARRVGPKGEVLGLDISAPMLERARHRAPADLPLRFALADATIYEFAPRAADVVVSRFGVMFFADPVLAFSNLRRALRRDGRHAFVCWREAKFNPWMILPLREALKHAPPLPEVGPEDPGPFAFADERRVRSILDAAGYGDVGVTPHDIDLDIAMGRGLDNAVASALMMGPTSRLLSDQGEAVRAAAASDIRAALVPYAYGKSVLLGAAIWLVTASNPKP